ncbi:hypothetical protein OIDMADRAFT_21302 [Oidiodendron maius Zn]|uniref:Uncharacterized protein n=1 Tax=Oidiodendron maius (strain Zn) TaxID=913774 RepID=A0A0C3GUQ2_OIDMZ|nr:hypothetical protein OIDMADRAFT_21302 [Oidiodendron maius Zn]
MSLTDKIIALTGGASGIGLATAQLLHSRGATVCVADVDPKALEAAEAHFSSLNRPYMVSKVDVSKRAEVDKWIDDVVARFGRLDGAANCAGIIGKHHGLRSISELEDEEWDKIMAVNLTGMMYCLRAELRKISDHGSIVNVASIQGMMGFALHGAYSASKHGVIGLTRSAAKEVGAREIRVNAVAPGSITTPLLLKAQEMNPNETSQNANVITRNGTSEEIASIIAFLLSSESSYVSGAVYAADGGWNC